MVTARYSRWFLFVVLGVMSVPLAGCEDTESAQNSTTSPMPSLMAPYYPQLAPIAPPPPKLEEVQFPSDPKTELWRPGYWAYNGSYYWVPGEVIPKPAPTAAWFDSYWLQHSYGWAYVPGYWQ